MRVLVDECLPRRLAADLSGHAARTVADMGWQGIGNGRLLALAASHFDAFVTIDARAAEDHPIPATIGVVVLRAQSNRYDTLRPLVPEILAALGVLRRGTAVTVEG